jgi:hypothetical protein
VGPVTPAQLSPPAPKADRTCHVLDPLVIRPFWHYHDEPLDAYLVALAAFQRGLAVSFHFEVIRRCERFSRLPRQGAMAELFSVSDGRRTHYFRRAQGDRTTRQASAIMDHKPATNALLARHGIEVPPGMVVERTSLESARAFCLRHPDARFLIKPVAGTLGQNVHRDLSADEVLELLAGQRDPVLLEVFVRGQEYRVHVVGRRYIGAVARLPAQVMGDGVHTLRELVATRNRLRTAHPIYRRMPIEIDAALVSAQGLALDAVPAAGHWVGLGRIPKNSAGGESPIRTHSLGQRARRVAVQVQQALGAPNVGIDLLVCDEGTPQERVVVLEANQCPFQTALVAPLEPAEGMGNHAAEALMDAYFPASRQAPRWPAASFDFVALREGLRSAAMSTVQLPVLQPDWQHQRLALNDSAQQVLDWQACVEVMRRQGLWVQTMRLASGERLVDALGAPHALVKGWAAWPPSAGQRCDP